jgi:ferredoxin-NADP reductase
VAQLVDETARTKSIVLDIPGWAGHRAGQHVDVRPTAEDGYQAQRSYSIASAPEDGYVVLTVERLDDGQVSSYLTQELRTGDKLELRGPIGGYFVREEKLGGPLFLVGGGSGVVPLRAMLRHYVAVDSAVPLRVLYSSRSLPDVIYRDELTRMREDDGLDIRFTLIRQHPASWSGYGGTIDLPLLAEVAFPSDGRSLTYICGPTGFVEAAVGGLVELGHDPSRIRTARFGSTGA